MSVTSPTAVVSNGDFIGKARFISMRWRRSGASNVWESFKLVSCMVGGAIYRYSSTGNVSSMAMRNFCRLGIGV
jgi:hypothetical protein